MLYKNIKNAPAATGGTAYIPPLYSEDPKTAIASGPQSISNIISAAIIYIIVVVTFWICECLPFSKFW